MKYIKNSHFIEESACLEVNIMLVTEKCDVNVT